MASPLAGLILAATATCLAAEVTVLAPRAHVIRSESHAEKRADAEVASASSADRTATAEVVIAGDGSWATARTARQSQGRSSVEAASLAERTHVSQKHGRTFAESMMKAMGFADTCNNLFYAGWMRTNGCRDEQMPEYNLPSCRCMRGGTAWPSKFCMLKSHMPGANEKVQADRKLAAQAIAHQVLQQHQREFQRHLDLISDERAQHTGNGNLTVTAAPSRSLLQQKSLEDPVTEDPQTTDFGEMGDPQEHDDTVSGVGDLAALEYEVYGGCDQCCERKFFFYWGLMAIPFTCCLVCACCCERHRQVTRHNKMLRDQLESTTLRLTQHQARDQAIFSAIDQNRDGELSVDEFTNQQTMRALHTVMDQDRNRAVNFQEFNTVGARPTGQ